MATVLEAVNESLSPDITHELGEMLGQDETQTKQGIASAAAVILAALKAQAHTDGGADKLLASFQPAQDAPDRVFDAVNNGRSDAILEPLFGVGVKKVVDMIRETTDQDLGSYLLVAAPLVMHALEGTVNEQKLDGAGVTKTLDEQYAAYTTANPQFASEINAALDAGQNVVERAWRIRGQFTDAEWGTLYKTPALAAYAVMMSSLSGPVGINKEITALLDALREFGSAAEPDSLVGLVSREYTTSEQVMELGANRENASAMMRDACLESLRILTEKEPHPEALAYKEFVIDVATRVANAAIDGGFMSIGGTPVSDEEKMTLDLIAAALAYQPES